MCTFSSTKYDDVHIIPPGFHVNPKYPKLFLAQKVFESLDILLKEKIEFRKKHIVFVIDDKEYHQVIKCVYLRYLYINLLVKYERLCFKGASQYLITY